MLRVQGLNVRYGAIAALNDVDLAVGQGEIVTLIGANGAGKSTLVGAVAGLIKPSRGAVRFEDQDVTGVKAHRLSRRGLILVPEGRRVFVNLTVQENLVLGGDFRPMDDAFDEDMEQVFRLFPRLAERRLQKAGTLSGGEQQMLALGRARLLMMDEPGLGLGPILVAEVFKIITHIRDQGVTVLLIEQNAAAALAIADWGYVLEVGKVVLSGTGAELACDERVKQAYLGLD